MTKKLMEHKIKSKKKMLDGSMH